MRNRVICLQPVYFSLIIAFFLFMVSNIEKSPKISMIALTLFFIGAVILLLFDFMENQGLIYYLICMFTFLIGGAVLPFFQGEKNWMSNLTEHEYIVACNCMFLSVFALLLGKWFSERFKISLRDSAYHQRKGVADGRFHGYLNDSKFDLRRIGNLSFYFFLVTMAIAVIGQIQKLMFVLSRGYIAIYTEYSASGIANRAQIMSMTALFIGLASKPEKKRLYVYVIVGFINPILKLAQGSRMSFVSYILFIALYIYNYSEIRDRIISKTKKRNKKIILLVLALVVIFALTPFLYKYGYDRANLSSYDQSRSSWYYVLEFFSGQGKSYQLIGYAERYKGRLPGICYSFGTIIDRVMGNNIYSYGTTDCALKTNKFGAVMTYLESRWNYQQGMGLGSSYIAELYYDFGYAGVIAVNILLGFYFRSLVKWNKNSIFWQAVYYILFYYSMAIPRGNLLEPIDQLFSLSSLMIFLLIFGLSYKKKIGVPVSHEKAQEVSL